MTHCTMSGGFTTTLSDDKKQKNKTIYILKKFIICVYCHRIYPPKPTGRFQSYIGLRVNDHRCDTLIAIHHTLNDTRQIDQ